MTFRPCFLEWLLLIPLDKLESHLASDIGARQRQVKPSSYSIGPFICRSTVQLIEWRNGWLPGGGWIYCLYFNMAIISDCQPQLTDDEVMWVWQIRDMAGVVILSGIYSFQSTLSKIEECVVSWRDLVDNLNVCKRDALSRLTYERTLCELY